MREATSSIDRIEPFIVATSGCGCREVRPQDRVSGAVEEILRLREVQRCGMFRDMHPHLHHLERHMIDLQNGPGGMLALATRIEMARSHRAKQARG